MSMLDVRKDLPPPLSVAQLPASPAGWQPVDYQILRDGTLAVITTDVDLWGERQRVYAAMQRSTSPDPPSRLAALGASGTARIWILTPSGWVEGPTFPLENPIPLFDRFSDGRWLVVAVRTSGAANARVLSSSGLMLDRFMLGDGIEHVAVDANDRIWVGWFDEGIFGNDNWRAPDHRWPPSSNGVACFTASGTLLPLPEWPAAAGTIADCYALNVTGAGVWVCPYNEFPLVRFLVGEPTRWWRSNLLGAGAIAIDGSHALVGGGFREEASRLALVALDGEGKGEEVRVLASWSLPLRRLPPSTQEWSPVWKRPTLFAGRAATLHLVDDGSWYRWNVADLLAELK